VGFNGCWVTVKDRKAEDIVPIVGGQIEPNEGEWSPLHDDYSAGELASGWGFVCLLNYSDRVFEGQILHEISKGTSAVACLISENTMNSSCECWVDGKRIWRVSHDGQFDNVKHIEIEGHSHPPNLKELQEKAETNQATDENVDFMFDVPLKLSEDISGFKIDELETRVIRAVRISLQSLRM
jgi:hypothetical protein